MVTGALTVGLWAVIDNQYHDACRILTKNGVKKILVVTGYKKQFINQEQIDSKNKHHFKRVRDTGKWAYLSMKLAAGSSALYACMDFTKWLVANEGTIVRGLSFLDVVEPFAQAILLMKMSSAFLRLVVVHRDWTTSTHAKDSQVVCDWFYAQTSFFDKVTDVMIGL